MLAWGGYLFAFVSACLFVAVYVHNCITSLVTDAPEAHGSYLGHSPLQ